MRLPTPAEAVKLIRSHQSVYIQGSTSIPEVLVRAMADRGPELEGVTVYSGFAVGRADAPYCRPEYRESFLVNSLFVANNIRRWLADGYGQSTPAFLGEIPGLFRDGTLPVDVASVPPASGRHRARALPVSLARSESLSHSGRLPITSGMSPSAVPRNVICVGSKATARLAAS